MAVFNIFLSASLSMLWGMINALQIVAHLPMFNVSMPANCAEFFQLFLDCASFNIIKIDKVYEWLRLVPTQTNVENQRLLNSTSANSTNSTGFTESAPPDEGVYKTLGPIFLTLIGILLLVCVLVLLKVMSKLGPFKQAANKIFNWIYYFIFWNTPLRYIMESYINLTLTTLTFIATTDYWSDNFKITETLFSFVVMFVCVVAPAVISLYFACNIKKFLIPSFKRRFDAVIKNWNWRSAWCSLYFSIFCYRRLIEVILIVFLQNYAFAQLQLMTFSSVMVIITFGSSDAFRLPRDRRLEYFNETTILWCIYHFFCFTDFVEVPERTQVGYSLMGFVMLNFIGNLIVMLYVAAADLCHKMKKWRFQFRMWKFKRSKKNKPKKQMTDAQFFEAQRLNLA